VWWFVPPLVASSTTLSPRPHATRRAMPFPASLALLSIWLGLVACGEVELSERFENLLFSEKVNFVSNAQFRTFERAVSNSKWPRVQQTRLLRHLKH